MSQTARRCPSCKQLNYGGSEFCQRCGSDIRSEVASFLPWAQHDELPPMAAAAREQGRRFAHVETDASGSGLVWAGLVITTAGLLIDLSLPVLAIVVLVGLGIVATGLWQLRIDYASLSRLGVWLAAVAVISLGVIGWRILEPDTPNPVALIQARETPTPRLQTEAPGEAQMLMHRGGPEHRGVNAGPAPTGSLFRAWRFDTGGELYSSPAISGNTLVIGSKSGFLYGLDATTGAELWSRDLGQYIVRSTPAIQGETVVVNNGYEVVALGLADGTSLWTADISFAGNTSPTIVDRMVYIASQNGSLYALDLRTGEQRWRIQIDGLIFGSPTVDDGRLFIANDTGKVFGLKAENGAVLWREELNGGVFAPIISDNGFVYFTTSTGVTYCLDGEMGREQWHYDAGGASGGALTLNEVVVSADTGGVTSINAEKGTINWLVPTGSQVTVGPIVVGNLVLVASGQTIYGLDLKTGEYVFTYATGYSIQIAPVVLNGMIYVGGRDGYLDAIIGDAAE